MKKRVLLFKDIRSTFDLEKKIYPEFCRIRGIGKSMLISLLKELNITATKKIIDLTAEEKKKLEELLATLVIEDKRKKQILENIYLEQAIKSNRGFRHLHKLKLRGQKTKSTGRKTKKTRVKKK